MSHKYIYHSHPNDELFKRLEPVDDPLFSRNTLMCIVISKVWHRLTRKGSTLAEQVQFEKQLVLLMPSRLL